MDIKTLRQNKKIRKAEKKQFIEESYDNDPLKFRDWFSIKGIRNELKNVSWLSLSDLFKASATVIGFSLFMMLFFFAGDTAIAEILKSLF